MLQNGNAKLATKLFSNFEAGQYPAVTEIRQPICIRPAAPRLEMQFAVGVELADPKLAVGRDSEQLVARSAAECADEEMILQCRLAGILPRRELRAVGNSDVQFRRCRHRRPQDQHVGRRRIGPLERIESSSPPATCRTISRPIGRRRSGRRSSRRSWDPMRRRRPARFRKNLPR